MHIRLSPSLKKTEWKLEKPSMIIRNKDRIVLEFVKLLKQVNSFYGKIDGGMDMDCFSPEVQFVLVDLVKSDLSLLRADVKNLLKKVDYKEALEGTN